MSEKLVCPICGEPTRVWYGNPHKDLLCGTHADELKAGKIYDANGVFFDATTKSVLGAVKIPFTKKAKSETEKVLTKEQPTETQETSTQTTLTCLICKKDSNGKHFCLECYHKYKNRSIDIRIINCQETQILDSYGNLQYKCEDGRKVRSKSEKIISDFLFKYKIRAIYEKTVFYYPEEGDTIELHPDFYLPDYDIYLEHNGLSTQAYKSNKAKTEEMYKSLNCKLIVTTEADLEDIDKKLKPLLKIN